MKVKMKLAAALGISPAAAVGARTSTDLTEAPPSIEGLIDDVLVAQTENPRFFRPSMLNGCDRANVFHYMHAPSHPQRQNPRLKRILDNGTLVHRVLQGYLADHPQWWFAPESRIFVEIDGALVRGSCDGVLIRRKDLYRVGVEIKSINNNQYAKLTKPKPDHVFQSSIYGKLQKLDWIVILYWNKDTQFIKEFPVRPSPEHWAALKDRIKFLHSYVKRGALPVYKEEQCDLTFCGFVDHCRSKGGPP